MHSLVIVPFLSIPHEATTLLATFEIISLRSNMLDTAWSVVIMYSCDNGTSEGEKVKVDYMLSERWRLITCKEFYFI